MTVAPNPAHRGWCLDVCVECGNILVASPCSTTQNSHFVFEQQNRVMTRIGLALPTCEDYQVDKTVLSCIVPN